jgi:hypothetical protein
VPRRHRDPAGWFFERPRADRIFQCLEHLEAVIYSHFSAEMPEGFGQLCDRKYLPVWAGINPKGMNKINYFDRLPVF